MLIETLKDWSSGQRSFVEPSANAFTIIINNKPGDPHMKVRILIQLRTTNDHGRSLRQCDQCG